MLIKRVGARIIKNSRREDTIEIEISTLKGKVRASAPSGKSKGKHEVPAFGERGIQWSLKLARNFCSRLQGNISFNKFDDLNWVEEEIKKFESSFGRLGANTTYAIETALLKALAKERDLELWEIVAAGRGIKIPMPVGNCIGGGLHAHNKRKPDFQEFLLIPQEKSFTRAVLKNLDAYNAVKKKLKKRTGKFFVTDDEKGWETSLSNEEVLRVIEEIAQEFNLRIGIDVAASSFFNKNYYYKNLPMTRTRDDQINYIGALARRYDLFYIEDPLQEEDFLGFAKLNKNLEDKHMIVGDDLTVTSLERLKTAKQLNAINAIIIKPNQCGSLMEVAKVVDFCRQHNIKTIFSHRSGETMDTALGDLAVGFGADFIKTGIFGRERMAKLGRIMAIEKSLGLS